LHEAFHKALYNSEDSKLVVKGGILSFHKELCEEEEGFDMHLVSNREITHLKISWLLMEPMSAVPSMV
jgi:hypothetical protein